MCIRAATLTVLAVAFVAAPLAAAARPAPQAPSDRLLWATVNVCDTPTHPDTIGIRASMPGTASGREIMFMRFETQYLSVDDGKWHNVAGVGDSGFLQLGSANVKAREKGRYVTIKPKSDSIELRGMVIFEWRLKGEVVRTARRRTHKGHRSKAGADPAGYSAANCTVTN